MDANRFDRLDEKSGLRIELRRLQSLLATSKSGTLSLRRDQGEMAVFWDSRSRRL